MHYFPNLGKETTFLRPFDSPTPKKLGGWG